LTDFPLMLFQFTSDTGFGKEKTLFHTVLNTESI
jgi:hypothetical protein